MAVLTVLLPLVVAGCVILLLALLLTTRSQVRPVQILGRVPSNLRETMRIDLVDRKISSTDVVAATLDLDEDVSSPASVLSSVYVY